jgi:hypothetical protein
MLGWVLKQVNETRIDRAGGPNRVPHISILRWWAIPNGVPKLRRKINLQKVAFFCAPQNVVQLTSFRQRITTTSPQKTTQKITHFAKTPSKNAPPPRTIFFLQLT